ncbi:hypothetical protein LAZ67_15000202 [Cordylochernes scorpioides]|uniref:Uncharacterized protein n=1 Tax=Cordylochernes scorpioides TaxID=51811 RepID=A0ABY6LCN7_9ARAC|nr:hypothetical protein LAZ67_15000202 [Cordylochernes scorpioides]
MAIFHDHLVNLYERYSIGSLKLALTSKPVLTKGEEKCIAYASRTQSPFYSTTERKCLAVIFNQENRALFILSEEPFFIQCFSVDGYYCASSFLVTFDRVWRYFPRDNIGVTIVLLRRPRVEEVRAHGATLATPSTVCMARVVSKAWKITFLSRRDLEDSCMSYFGQ